MIEYIDETSANEVDTDWSGTATQAEIDSALMQANTWLNAAQLVELTEIPLQVKYAGVELAKLSLSGELYKDVEKVTSKTVSAGSGVSVSKSYSEPFENQSRDMNYIKALVKPYMASSVHFYVDRG